MRSRALVFVGAIAMSSSAFAQRAQPADPHSGMTTYGPSLGPPHVTWLSGTGDANGAAGAWTAPTSLFEPLRLSLFGDSPPSARARGIRCEDYEEATTTLTAGSSGSAHQHAAAFRLAPSLTLVGFARNGCPHDAAISAGIVHALPVAPNIFLTTSTGLLSAPHQNPRLQYQLRTDVVFSRPDGGAISVGIGTTGGGTSIAVGGVL